VTEHKTPLAKQVRMGWCLGPRRTLYFILLVHVLMLSNTNLLSVLIYVASQNLFSF